MVDIFQEDLKELRTKIDDIDQTIIELLSQRKKLTDNIVAFKTEQQAKVFNPNIENSVLGWREQLADEHNLSKDYIVDIFRLVMFDAYQLSCTSYQKVAKAEQVKQVVIIGDNNPVAHLLQDLFTRSNYHSLIIADVNSVDQQKLDTADAILVTEPLQPILDVLIAKFKLSPKTLIANLNNLDSNSMDYLMANYSGPSVGLHPMFSPASKSLTKEVIFVCHGNMPTRYVWLIDQLKMWGLSPIQASTAEHDQLMLTKSSLNQFMVLIHAMKLVKQNIDLEQLLTSSGRNYRLSLMMLGRYFSNSKQLKLDRMFQPESIQLLKQCSSDVQQLIDILEAGDKTQLIELYESIQHWFGEHAAKFDDESNRLSQLQPNTQMKETL